MSTSKKEKTQLDAEAVKNFCDYLKIPSVHPDVDYDDCVSFLKKQATALNLPIKVHYCVPKKPVVILTWTGTDSSLPTILLNSHMDVVPVFEDEWTFKPFGAEIKDNKIYARGAQDMKCVGIQYLEAVKRLKLDGVRLKRTIHICFVPDEEIGGADGMKKFVETKEFRELNVGAAFDEGSTRSNDEFLLYYGEKFLWSMQVHCPGDPGHGSLLLNNTAGEKVAYIVKQVYDFRAKQVQTLKNNPTLSSSDVISINLTKIQGGVQSNVIPPEFVLTFDCRIPPDTDAEKFENMLNQWCKNAGEGVWIEYLVKDSPTPNTKLDESNIFWTAFKEATDKMGLKINPQICMGVSDARFIRQKGISDLGFSPMNNTVLRLHAHDEYLGVETFLKGIEIYYNIIMSVGNKV